MKSRPLSLEKKHSSLFLLILCLCVSVNITHAQNGTWTWMHGSTTFNQLGNFGTQGVAAPTNDPPGTYEACEWTDLQGNFWYFGGLNNAMSEHTALWKFEPATNMWTWVKGPQTLAQAGVYGVQGVPAPTNNPGSRSWGVMTWVDQAGDLWLFGGYGYDASGLLGSLNDLWRYNIATNTWTWMKGPNVASDPGTYGTLQVPAATNVPPSRFEANTCWTSNAGDLWLYGGGSFAGYYNDMWRYNIATNTWTWMSGPNTVGNLPNYGAQFVPAASNTPGGRYTYSKWKDNMGNFWLYGGTSMMGSGSDMWMYDVNTNLWVWMAGSNAGNPTNTFTTQCQFTNGYPDSRTESRACWTDDCGRFWQYGGFNINGTGNDLWMFDPASNQFNWITGSLLANQPANFGTMTVPAATNSPHDAAGSVGFKDNNGDFWMFGGWTAAGHSNVMWRYVRDPNCPGGSAVNANFTGNPTTGCVPLTVNFTATSNNAQNTYHWDFGDTNTLADTSNTPNSSYTYTLAGTYTVTLIVNGTSTCGPGSDTSTLVVTVNPNPVANLGNDTTICNLLNLTLNAGNAGATYTWSNAASSQTINVTAAGTYWVDVNFNGCHDTDTIVIQQFSPPSLGPDTAVCQGQNVPLSGGTGQSWLWSTGATTQNITVNTTGSYWVETTNGPCVSRDTMDVTVQALPIVNIGPDSVLCPNTSYLLDAGNPGANYLWSTGATSQTISVNTAGTYSVVVTMNTCPGSDTVSIQTSAPVGLEDVASLCDILSLTLDAGNPGATYLWSTGATTQTINVNAAGEYYVQVTSGSCILRDTIEVSGSPGEGALYIPNTFTPNGNALNDKFMAQGDGIVDFKMRIFDRWGNLIFESTTITDAWDGKVKGNLAQIDTYVYVIDYTTLCSEGKRIRKIGHINVLR